MSSMPLTEHLESKLQQLCLALVNQERARIVIPAYAASTGYWFGGGNLVADAEGNFYIVGRYRNHGDSRTGLAAGSRGLELAVFRSRDRGDTFEKVVSIRKEDLATNEGNVLSIEGTALRLTSGRVELFLSTEKDGRRYPERYADYLKPGTGIWSIDYIESESVEKLQNKSPVPLVSSNDPGTIHVKDPFLAPRSGDTDSNMPRLMFCSHPMSWTSSNTGYASLVRDSLGRISAVSNAFDIFPRGNTWDVAISRGTAVVDLPKIGAFAELDVQLMFYDGGECVRDLKEHTKAVSRPRGYSCEELGGVAYATNHRWENAIRLSRFEPMFVSPYGTGCSRYVDVFVRPEGMYATWQQSQEDLSQPLVMNFLPTREVESILS